MLSLSYTVISIIPSRWEERGKGSDPVCACAARVVWENTFDFTWGVFWDVKGHKSIFQSIIFQPVAPYAPKKPQTNKAPHFCLVQTWPYSLLAGDWSTGSKPIRSAKRFLSRWHRFQPHVRSDPRWYCCVRFTPF